MGEAFYERQDEDTYRSKEHTTGPWDPSAQHAGPPAALLAGIMQQAVEQPLARLTFEILRPVPVATVRASAEVLRPGRAVALVEGVLADEAGPCVLARAWGIRQGPIEFPAVVPTVDPIPHSAGREPQFFRVEAAVGWHTAMEFCFVGGEAFAELGPAKVWMRSRMPLVAGETLRPLERVLLAADGGNGVSASVDIADWLFINTELSVHLTRHPEGEWVGLDAASTYEPHGVGLATTVLHDERGPVGRGAQALFCAPRLHH